MKTDKEEKLAEMSAKLEDLENRVHAAIKTRGVNSRGVQPEATGLDLGSIHEKVSWRDIQRMKKEVP